VVLSAADGEAGRSAEALEQLCQAYWYPLYAFIRRQGWSAEDAPDLTQAFLSHLLQNNRLAQVHPEKGRFRSFLMASARHFLANEWDRQHRLKRGGGAEFISLDAEAAEGRYKLEPGHDESPEKIFARRWAQTVVEQVAARLTGEFAGAGQADRFEVLKDFLTSDPGNCSYGDAAARLDLSVSAVTSAIHRMRARFRDLFRAEIANTVGSLDEVDEEIRYLLTQLSP